MWRTRAFSPAWTRPDGDPDVYRFRNHGCDFDADHRPDADRFRSNLMFAGGLLVMSTSLLSVTFVEGVYSGVRYAAVFGINGVTRLISRSLAPFFAENIWGVSRELHR